MGARRYRPRQEINRCLKYLIFFVNFVFWICGLTCTILGVYLYAKDFRAVLEAIDFFFNPSILLIVCGCIMFLIAFLGCTGALRENTCMLKGFSLCLFFAYVTLVILAFVLFILFYSDTKTGVSIQSLLQNAVAKYHDNENMREMMDYLQTNLGCCGVSSQGYKDWNTNQLYNCSSANGAPEQCGVPTSCCKTTKPSDSVQLSPPPPIAISPVPGVNAQALELDSKNAPNPRCGFHAQEKSVTDLQNILYTDGCLNLLQRAFEGHAIIIGAVIGAIIVPVCLSVTLSNVLARQIAHQRYLLVKEARKERRRRRRENKYKKHSTPGVMTLGADAQQRVARHAMEITCPQPPPMLKGPPAIFFTESEHLYKPPLPYHDFVRPDQRSLEVSRKQSSHCVQPSAPIYDVYDRAWRRRKTQKGTRAESKTRAAPRGRRHSRPHRNDCGNRGSRSHDEAAAYYNGPIIVELSSTTHDLPPEYRAHEDQVHPMNERM